MKRAIIPISFPPLKGNEVAEAAFDIYDPGDICDCIIAVKEKQVSIISRQAPNKEDFEFIPTLMTFVDPDSKPRKRHFIIAPPEKIVESHHGEIFYRGRFLFPNGGYLNLFEEVHNTAEAPPISNFGEPG